MWVLDALNGLPKEFAVFSAAALPLFEVRGSVPLGFYLGLPAHKILLLSFLGSVLPALPLFWFLNFMTERLRKINAFDRFFGWLFARSRAKSALIEKYETLGLTLFIAVPLPGTGVWTGVVAAYLLGLSWLEVAIAASVGTFIAASFLTLAGLGLIKLFI